MLERQGRLVVLTGVSRGLGRALAEELIRLGQRVAGCARSEGAIRDLREHYAPDHLFSVVDTADARTVRSWAEEIVAAAGPPELLVNNAAVINANAALWKVPPEEFSRLIDVNIKGVFHTTRAFLPGMIDAGRGVVVNFSSGWGRSVSPEVAPYCTSKWAIEGMTRALAEELPAGLAAVPLNPGIIDTAMLRSCFGAGAQAYPKPAEWARRAAPFLLGLGPRDNGRPLTVPDR